MIKKTEGGYTIYSEDGKKKLSKEYKTKEEAEKRLAEIEKFKGNYIQVINAVDTTRIRRETDSNGDEIIIIPSKTLPDNIVMNGGLYPSEEIEKAYRTLEGTPAPVGHPQDDKGNFVSASSEIGVNRYQCGVFNGQVKREDGRVFVEKRINVRVAKTLNRGKELLSRLYDIIDGNSSDPIHTSTGIYLDPQYLEYPRVADNGKEYDWIARNMHFDHDAILLDEEGAATPADGVGMMVNQKGDNYQALRCNLEDIPESAKQDDFIERIVARLKQILSPKSEEDQGGHGGRETKEEDDEMSFKQKILDMLKANGTEVADDATEDQLLDAVKQQQTATNAAEDTAEASEVVVQAITNALKPLNERFDAIETKLNAQADVEQKALADKLKANGFEDEDLEGMSVNAMQKLASKFDSGSAFFANASYSANQEGNAEDVLPD